MNRDDTNVTLELADSLWLAKHFNPYDSYLDAVRSTYLADVESVDVLYGGVDLINNWTDEKTHGRISKVLHRDDVGPDTTSVLLRHIL